MIKNILKQRINLFLYPLRVFSFHWKAFSSNIQKNIVNPDEFLSKDQYLKKITEQRENEEKEEEESKKLQELYIKMKRREYEVSLSRVDFAKIQTDNINLIPKDSFQTIDELFYFLKNLSTRASEQNIEKCVKGLLSLADKIESKDLENPYYVQFLEVVRINIDLISESRNYILIAKFLDLFCVNDSKLWEKLERKVLNRQRGIPIKEYIEIFLHFANQKEGSDHFYDRCEEIFQINLETLSFEELFSVLQGYFNSKYGTKDFMLLLLAKIKENLSRGNPHELIKLAFICTQSQNNLNNLLKAVEENLISSIDKLSFDDLTNCGIAFGSEDFHDKLFVIIEQKIMNNIKDITPLKIKQILEALAFNYKGSKELMIFLKPHILSNLNYFTPSDLAKIVKSYYILEAIESNDDFFRVMEKRIVSYLKDIKNIKNEELLEFVRCYCVTRNGSREFYKLLELVVDYRFKELIKNPEYVKGIFNFYSTSGFCSPELLKKFEAFL